MLNEGPCEAFEIPRQISVMTDACERLTAHSPSDLIREPLVILAIPTFNKVSFAGAWLERQANVLHSIGEAYMCLYS